MQRVTNEQQRPVAKHAEEARRVECCRWLAGITMLAWLGLPWPSVRAVCSVRDVARISQGMVGDRRRERQENELLHQ